MREMRVSAAIGIAVTVLAVVTALAFSFATVSYQAEVMKLKRINNEYRITMEGYRVVLENIKKQFGEAGMAVR